MRAYVDANPRSVAYVVEESKKSNWKLLDEEVTNNEAEYLGFLYVLDEETPTEILSDSQLVVNQLNYKYNIKEDRLRKLAMQVWNLTDGKVKFTWIPRKENLSGKLLG